MGLKDKASKIDFASLITQHAPSFDAKQPKTAPGAMMAYANDARSDLLRENEVLKQQATRATTLEAQRDDALADLKGWEGAKPTRMLNASQIRRSRFANRHESHFASAEFVQLKHEIHEAGGNIQPIKVRSLGDADGSGVQYEVVYGHRRLEACGQLGLPVLAVIDNVDDRTLFIEMERENRHRADLSPWEQGVMYARALDSGLFASNKQLANALGVDLSNLGKSLALARLPDEIVNAFATPLDIQLRWAPLLNKALDVDAAGTLSRAKAIVKGSRPGSPKLVLNRLVTGETVSVTTDHEEIASKVIVLGKKQAATLIFDSDGHATIKLNIALSKDQRSALENSLGKLIDLL